MGEIVKLHENMPNSEFVVELNKLIDGRNDMVWMSMQYRCNRIGCRVVETVYCGVGVEGPESLRDRNAWMASPFIIQCAVCKGEANHINWQSDKTFLPIDAPKCRYFRVPRQFNDWQILNLRSIVFVGDLVDKREG